MLCVIEVQRLHQTQKGVKTGSGTVCDLFGERIHYQTYIF